MMLQYRSLAKLKTKKIVFEDAFPARDSATLEHLKELSSKRSVIEESINQKSFITEAIAREMSGGSTSRIEQERLRLEQYIPLLENFISRADFLSVTGHIVPWTSKLKMRWSSAISSSSFFDLRGPKFFQINNLRFELAMTLFLYGAILWERALEILSADLKQSAFIFRQAAGVFHHLAQDVLPSLHPAISAEMPQEVTTSASAAMSLISLAQAQAVYVRRAEGMGNTSCGVLAKLHYGVAELLSEATDALISGAGAGKSVSSHFLEFISSAKALHELRSQKFVAESLKEESQLGFAIGVLRCALSNTKKKIPGEESWKAVFRKEIDNATEALRKLEHENDFVWHDKLPLQHDLPLPQVLGRQLPRGGIKTTCGARKYYRVVKFDCSSSKGIRGKEKARPLSPSKLFSPTLLSSPSDRSIRFIPSTFKLSSNRLKLNKVSKVVAAVVSEESAVGSSSAGADVFKLTYLEGNSWLWEVGGVSILVDPILVGNLDFGIPWLYDAAKKFLKSFQLSDLPEVDCLLITQSLDDHCHLKTLKPLSESSPNLRVIATPNAKPLLDPLFKNVTYLEPGQSSEIEGRSGSKVGVEATPGPVLGPPWQRPENGYLVSSPKGQLTLYYEPHCVYNKDDLEKKRADIVITPVIKQLLPKFTLVLGQEDAVQLAKLLQARFVVPMKNGDLDSKGLLSSLIQAEGTIESFKELLAKELPDAQVLEPTPGVPLEIVAP
ncbi:hypothetical protein Tsubulata_016493 [Turnera subulata]|uniref:BRO1 domain-containing protein n=1 Tax=Turnera subulata TaxID=218843 RepID=A0A9Q0G184_9ROSI|nr:hypothetical protein Tsubulata_016493 [Turnera subulata]